VTQNHWDDLKKKFTEHFKETNDPARWEDSNEWQISIDGGTEPDGWSISMAVTNGHAASYSIDYEGEEGSSVSVTY